jgi:Uma2 family endonuclease
MAQPHSLRPSPEELWARLEALGPHERGEIIDGELHVQPRPRFGHGRANTFLGHHIGGSFDFDDDGPGGWWIIVEPGIELPGAPEVSPDLAGWRRERMPTPPEVEPIRVTPDWVCEVLSPSNARWNRLKKFPFYARVGVRWLWVIDPRERTLEVRKLDNGLWTVLQVFGEEEENRAEPFSAVGIPLSRMWTPTDGDR